MRDWWRIGDVFFKVGATFAIAGIIFGQGWFAYFGLGLVVGSYPFLLAGAVENEGK